MKLDLKHVGAVCKNYRVSLGFLQSDVARETGYTTENISAFETGRNDNMAIFFWYLKHGLNIDDIEGD